MAVLEEVRRDYGIIPNYVDGNFVEAPADEYLDSYNPAKGEVIAKTPLTTKEGVDQAVQAAARAFEEWSQMPVTERIQYLVKLKLAIEKHKEEIARIISQNMGKTIREARGELRRALENVDAALGMPTLTLGEKMIRVTSNIDEEYIREPLGVFAIITPMNFPVMIPFWFLPYAIATGNTVVLKPSELDPAPMYWVMKVIHEEVGLPPGVVNLVNGAKDTVQALITHKDVAGVTFVGSTPVAKIIYETASKAGKRVLAQGGAKNPEVVMPDANFERTVNNLLGSVYNMAGQRCLAAANIILVGDIYDRFINAFVEGAKKLKIGYGLDESVDMGPMASKKGKEKVLYYIEKGLEEGARLILDGRGFKSEEYPNGFFLGPSVFVDAREGMTITQEEIFGPVAIMIRAEDFDEAVELSNNLAPYGNAASIFTESGKYAREYALRVNAGNIGINIGVAAPLGYFPFGGRKLSFFGTLHGQMDAIDFFTDKKVVITRWW